MFTYSYANTPLGQSERVHYLSYFINIFIYIYIYYNTNEIPGELSCENMISSPLLWLHNKSRLAQEKTVSVKWFGISLVFI